MRHEYCLQEQLMAGATTKERNTVARSACYAAIGLHKWDLVGTFGETLEDTDNDKPFMQALTAIYKNKFDDALVGIQKARGMLAQYFPSMLGEAGTYSRGYDYMVKFQVGPLNTRRDTHVLQLLAEMEESVMYKQAGDAKKKVIQETWSKRLAGCDFDPDIWFRILRVWPEQRIRGPLMSRQLRSIVLPPWESMDQWIEYSDLCRKKAVQTGNPLGLGRSRDVLEMLLGWRRCVLEARG